MKRAMQHIGDWIEDEEGATAIEYALLAALIAGIIATTVAALGPKVVGLYTSVNDKL